MTDDFFRSRIDQMIDFSHPLALLASRLPWTAMLAGVAPYLAHKELPVQHIAQAPDLLAGPSIRIQGGQVSTAGRPRLSPRLMVALTLLKNAFDLSDEELVERFAENVYWQHFAGFAYFEPRPPCDATQIGRFRSLLGEAGLESLISSTLVAAVDMGAVNPALAALHTSLERAERIRSQQRHSKNKLYALHAPEVECIGKGKARQPYEFGVKVSIAVTHKQGLMVGARSFTGNPYDGHTLSAQIEQSTTLMQDLGGGVGKDAGRLIRPRQAIVDLGFRGKEVDAANPGLEIIHRGRTRA